LCREPAVEQLGGDAGDHPRFLRRGLEAFLPRVGREVPAADLHRHAAGDEVLRAQPCTGLVRQPRDLALQLRAVGDIRFEGFFRADLFLVEVRHDRSVVDPGGSLLHALRVTAEDRAQPRRGGLSQFAKRADAERLDLGRRFRAEAEQLADRQGVQQAGHVLRPHHDEAIGLAQVRGDLRHQLVGGQAHGCGESGAVADALLDLTGNVLRAAERADAGRDVEESFIERQALHQGRELVEDRKDFLRDRAVVGNARGHADRVRATAQCLARRHGRVHPELAHLVARGGDDASPTRPADDHRLAAQCRIVALLD
jgi:hypothetical protein